VHEYTNSIQLLQVKRNLHILQSAATIAFALSYKNTQAKSRLQGNFSLRRKFHAGFGGVFFWASATKTPATKSAVLEIFFFCALLL
jgi:hypothetical protein